MENTNKLQFYSGIETVTGANFVLECSDGRKIMIDCGLLQGEQFAEMKNRESFKYDPASIDTLIVTHAHLDHVGRIPKLVREGFHGKIYSTQQTKQITELVLNDAVHILAEEAERDKDEPLYSISDVENIFPLWQTVPYYSRTEIDKDISFVLKDAGHILGSAMVEISAGNRKILFTGDLGNSPSPLLRDTDPVGDVDCLVMESTYGNKNHESKEQRVADLERIIKESIARGGTLVIPAFSVDRTQVFLYELNNMVEQKRIPSVPVYLDSPLATKVTDVYESSSDLFNERVKSQIAHGDRVFDFPHLHFTVSQSESREIKYDKGAKIILAGSGMSVGGRVIGHEEALLPDPKNTILLVGYQTVGSLGRKLADGEKTVNIHGKKIEVKARIETLYGYSAHKDGDHLFEFVTTSGDRLKKIFVVMGEPNAAMHLTQRINNELYVEALIPKIDTEYVV